MPRINYDTSTAQQQHSTTTAPRNNSTLDTWQVGPNNRRLRLLCGSPHYSAPEIFKQQEYVGTQVVQSDESCHRYGHHHQQ